MNNVVKGVGIAVITAAAVGGGSIFWGYLSSGFEAEAGKNPAIVALQAEVKAIKEEAEGFKVLHGTMNTAIAVNEVRTEDAITGFNQLRGAILNQ